MMDSTTANGEDDEDDVGHVEELRYIQRASHERFVTVMRCSPRSGVS